MAIYFILKVILMKWVWFFVSFGSGLVGVGIILQVLRNFCHENNWKKPDSLDQGCERGCQEETFECGRGLCVPGVASGAVPAAYWHRVAAGDRWWSSSVPKTVACLLSKYHNAQLVWFSQCDWSFFILHSLTTWESKGEQREHSASSSRSSHGQDHVDSELTQESLAQSSDRLIQRAGLIGVCWNRWVGKKFSRVGTGWLRRESTVGNDVRSMGNTNL